MPQYNAEAKFTEAHLSSGDLDIGFSIQFECRHVLILTFDKYLPIEQVSHLDWDTPGKSERKVFWESFHRMPFSPNPSGGFIRPGS